MKLLWAGWLILMSAASCFAATEQGTATPGEPEPVSFQVYLWPQDDPVAGFSPTPKRLTPEEAAELVPDETPYEPPAIAFAGEGQLNATDMDLQEGRLSREYRYRGPPTLTFFRPAPEGQEPGTRTPLGRVKLPDGETRVLLLFFPQADETYKIFPIRAEAEAVPPGHAMIMNLTPTPVGCSLGGEVFELGKGERSLESLVLTDAHLQMMLLASRDRNGNWRRQHFKKYSVGAQDRLLFIIYHPSGHTSHFKVEKLNLDEVSR